MDSEVYGKIKALADYYALQLDSQIRARLLEMQGDDNSHYLIYRALGIPDKAGGRIDMYQNVGRFLYKYAGSFLESSAMICIQHAYPDAQKVRIPNTLGNQPKTFEIDCLVHSPTGTRAHEIKWRDATTDGDHISKEATRVNVIRNHGYIPIRIMFYYPQREQAQKIQMGLAELYRSIGGEYYGGESAWNYMKEFTGIDLREILEQIAEARSVYHADQR